MSGRAWVEVLAAERARHEDWHVCYTGDGLGKTDYCAFAEDDGMQPCPIYLGLGEAIELASSARYPSTAKDAE